MGWRHKSPRYWLDSHPAALHLTLIDSLLCARYCKVGSFVLENLFSQSQISTRSIPTVRNGRSLCVIGDGEQESCPSSEAAEGGGQVYVHVSVLLRTLAVKQFLHCQLSLKLLHQIPSSYCRPAESSMQGAAGKGCVLGQCLSKA